MIKSCFLKLVFCMALIMGLSCSFAFAEEVEIIPDVSVTIDFDYNGTVSTLPTSIRNQNTGVAWVNSASFRSTDFIAYNSSALTSSWTDPQNHAVKLRQTTWANQASDGFLSFDNLVFTLDMTGELDGYYRFESDVYLGLGFMYGGSLDYDFSPSFTVNSAPVYVPDSENGMHLTAVIVGSEEITIKNYYYQTKNILSDMVHIYIYSTFYYDSSYGTSIDFDASPVFNSLGVMIYDFSVVRSGGNYNFLNFANNRFSYKLFSHVDPPVTPTPSPTPYPGQDTQESINQGVSNIEGQMNQLINTLNPQVSPIPTPAALTIDETLFDELETMTLPDVSDAQQTYSALWDIFNPLWWIIALLFSVTFVIGIFLYVLRGGFI